MIITISGGNKMKKLVSLLLVLLLILSTGSAALAAEAKTYDLTPIVYIRGNGEIIYDSEGNMVPCEIQDLFNDEYVSEEDSITKEKLIESCVNILLPFLAEGMLFDKWDNYAEAIYEEFSPLFEKATLDKNGNPQYGTTVSQEVLAQSEYNAANIDFKNPSVLGWYRTGQYDFCYDWRLSPYDHVDRLHEYIKAVMATTNSDGICIAARCMGGSLLHAYLERYGHLGHVKRVFYGEVLANGCAFISDCFSGKIDFSDEYMQLYLKQAEVCGESGQGMGIVLTEFASEIVTRTVDLFVQTGTANSLIGSVESLYNKLYKALMPSLILGTGMGTMPNYWVSVYEDDMDQALDLVFGKEGSARRQEYAGLIEKIQYYREHVSSDLEGFYKKISEDYGISVGVLARYGYLSMPIIESHDELSDSLVGLSDASFGATCSTATTTLTDDYINSRIAEDAKNAKYISPDKMVDLSTCYFPETTWVVKNSHHDDGEVFSEFCVHFLSYKNLTVSNDSRMSQFSVLDKSTSWAGCFVTPMTEDNCESFEWLSAHENNPTIKSRLIALMKWLSTMFNFFTKLLKGEISLGGNK